MLGGYAVVVSPPASGMEVRASACQTVSIGGRRFPAPHRDLAGKQLGENLVVAPIALQMADAAPNTKDDICHPRNEPTRRRDRRVGILITVPPRQAALHQGWLEVPRAEDRDTLVRPALGTWTKRLSRVLDHYPLPCRILHDRPVSVWGCVHDRPEASKRIAEQVVSDRCEQTEHRLPALSGRIPARAVEADHLGKIVFVERCGADNHTGRTNSVRVQSREGQSVGPPPL